MDSLLLLLNLAGQSERWFGTVVSRGHETGLWFYPVVVIGC